MQETRVVKQKELYNKVIQETVISNLYSCLIFYAIYHGTMYHEYGFYLALFISAHLLPCDISRNTLIHIIFDCFKTSFVLDTEEGHPLHVILKKVIILLTAIISHWFFYFILVLVVKTVNAFFV